MKPFAGVLCRVWQRLLHLAAHQRACRSLRACNREADGVDRLRTNPVALAFFMDKFMKVKGLDVIEVKTLKNKIKCALHLASQYYVLCILFV